MKQHTEKQQNFEGKDVSVTESYNSDRFDHCLGVYQFKMLMGKETDIRFVGEQMLSLGGEIGIMDLKEFLVTLITDHFKANSICSSRRKQKSSSIRSEGGKRH